MGKGSHGGGGNSDDKAGDGQSSQGGGRGNDKTDGNSGDGQKK